MTEVSGRMYPVSSNKFCLAPWTPFALAELKPDRRRDLDSVFMLVPRSIDPSCVISPAFEGSPGYIYTALAASYSRSLRHMNQTVCADDVTLETANTSVALTSRGEPTELVSQTAPITEERDLKRKKKKKEKKKCTWSKESVEHPQRNRLL